GSEYPPVGFIALIVRLLNSENGPRASDRSEQVRGGGHRSTTPAAIQGTYVYLCLGQRKLVDGAALTLPLGISGLRPSGRVVNKPRAMTNVFKQGEHICMLFDSEEEQTSIAAEYLADGFRNGRRCFHVAASRHAHTRLHQALSRLGVDVPARIRTHALVEG